MSSSDDSDFCDFSSNFEKLAQKNSKKFDMEYTRTVAAQGECSKNIDNEEEADNVLEIDNGENVEIVEKIDNAESSLKSPTSYVKTRLRHRPQRGRKRKSNEDLTMIASTSGTRRTRRGIIDELPPAAADNIEDRLDQLRRIADVVALNKKKKIPKPRRSLTRVSTNLDRPSSSTQVAIISETIEIEDEIPKQEVDPNPPVLITVDWQSVSKNVFKLKRFQRLDVIFNYYKEKHDVNPKLLFFTLDDKEIDLSHCCFFSLNLNGASIIEGGILPESCASRTIKLSDPSKRPSCLKLKLQFNTKQKEEFHIYVQFTEPMGEAIWQIMELLDVDFDELKVFFDGQIIKPTHTPQSLGIDDGDCLDVVVTYIQNNV